MTNLSSPVLYRERTLPSLGFYASASFIPIAVFLIALPFSVEVGLFAAAGSIPTILAITWYLSPLIELTSETLRVGKAQIETEFLGQAIEISGPNSFSERGPLLDTRAYTKFQVGVKELVKIEIQDEQDPTPYWLVATRNPEILAALINKL